MNAKTSKNAPRAELDIVAIKTKRDRGNTLPPRIAGEVKSYSIDPRGFEELDKKLRKKHGYNSRPEYSRYKWVNNRRYRKSILNSLGKEYGYNDFQYVIFCSSIAKKYEKEIRDFLFKENIEVVTHSEILRWLLDNRTNEYTDNQILQLIRLIKLNTENIKFK